MIWGIVAALVVLGVVLLVLAVSSVLRRLPGLRRAAMKLRQRVVDAQGLQDSVSDMRDRLAQVSAHAEATANRAGEIRNSGPKRER